VRSLQTRDSQHVLKPSGPSPVICLALSTCRSFPSYTHTHTHGAQTRKVAPEVEVAEKLSFIATEMSAPSGAVVHISIYQLCILFFFVGQ
jgi:hypothetical protein